jgi:ribonuclease R
MVRVALGLPGAFPEEVEREAEAAAKPLTEDDLRAREDFRGAATITIDPADARDHDDAVSAEPLPGGGIRLWVHIADVAHHVRPGTALDREAAARGTSVYFPGSVIPMIPHALSSGACSLQEGQDRLVQSVGIDYTREASVAAVRFADGVVRSAARLTYEEAAAVMASPGALRGRGEGGGKAAFLLALLAPLARRLTEARIARGALDLDLPEVEFDPGKEGLGEALRARGRTDAHRLIEEFMLAANEAVARRLAGSGVPALYRVHEPPDRAEVEEVEAILEPLGVRRKGGRSLAARLQHALARFRGRPEEPIVAKVVLRAMKLARYAAGRADHFGLALSHYTHFTSPIRRYPDLVVHRMLRGLRGGGGADPLPDAERLGAVAAEASRLERRAEEAERAVDELLTAHHMRARLGEVFEGRVSGVVKTGLFVALEGKGLPAGMIEGFAPAARAARHVLTEPVRARLEEVDLLRGRLRLSLVEG